jgi:hypothetical protein
MACSINFLELNSGFFGMVENYLVRVLSMCSQMTTFPVGAATTTGTGTACATAATAAVNIITVTVIIALLQLAPIHRTSRRAGGK